MYVIGANFFLDSSSFIPHSTDLSLSTKVASVGNLPKIVLIDLKF